MLGARGRGGAGEGAAQASARLQAARDGDGAAQLRAEGGQLVARHVAHRVHARARLRHHGPAQAAQAAARPRQELLHVAAARAVAHGRDGQRVLRHEAAQRGRGLLALLARVAARVQPQAARLQQRAALIQRRELGAAAHARIKPQHAPLQRPAAEHAQR